MRVNQKKEKIVIHVSRFIIYVRIIKRTRGRAGRFVSIKYHSMYLPYCVTNEYFPQVYHMIYRVSGCCTDPQQNLVLAVLRYGRSDAHLIDYTRHRMHNECGHSWACWMFSDGRCKY